MRLVFAALLLIAGCATSGTPPQRLTGCWIARSDDHVTRTMRWLPDPTLPGVLNGDLMIRQPNGQTQNSHFTLEPSESGWMFCDHEGGPTPRCRAVAEGQQGSLEGGRVFIDAYRENLRISVVGEGPERTVFRGQRDGCD